MRETALRGAKGESDEFNVGLYSFVGRSMRPGAGISACAEPARILHRVLRGLLLIVIIGIVLALGNVAYEGLRRSG
jgi:hypothetical protein